MGEIKFVGGLLMLGLFGMSLILFAVNFADKNSAAHSLDDTEGFSKASNEISGNLSSYRVDVINTSDSFYKSEILEGETVRTGGQFKIGPFTALSTATSLLTVSFGAIFGSGNAFGAILSTLLAFLVFVLVLLIWKTWAGRNPE